MSNAPVSVLNATANQDFQGFHVINLRSFRGPFSYRRSNHLESFGLVYGPYIEYCFWPQKGIYRFAPGGDASNRGPRG